MLKHLRLRPFITSLLVAFILILLLITVYPIYYGVRSVVLEQTSQLNLDLTYNNYQKISERLNQAEEIGLSVATNRGLIRALSNPPADVYESVVTSRELNAWINGMVYIRPYLTSIQVYSDSGLRRVGERIKPMSAIPWSEYLDAMIELDAVWVDSRRDEYALLDKRSVLTYVMRIRDTKNRSIGYVEVNVSEQALWDSVKGNPEAVPLFKRRSILLNREDRVMSALGFPGEIRIDERWFAGPARGQSEILDIDGQRFLSISTSKSSTGWGLIDYVPLGDVYRNVNTLRNFIVLVAAAVILLTVPVASFLSSKLIKPILRLLSGFKKVETGNFSTRLESYFIVEFNHLAQNYNSMVEQLNRLLEKLEEEHRLKRDVELRLLQSQINPHFLYNTLDMINWMAAMKGAKDVSRMAARLAKMFRISLSKKGPFIMLDEELDHVLVYAQIQQARFEDRFEFVDRIPDAFKEYYVPKIILQPFVENAIVHGFNGTMAGKATVVISAEQVDESRFVLIVADNGSGLTEKRESDDRDQLYPADSGGHGISNVNERIQLYFGKGFGVTLTANEPRGAKATLLLPIMKSPDNE
ncbi:cache domain-containing sensor histidine kinase [Cohnella hongkongensis]|uniref:Sensor histidine kinase n=1 Tax=Cohnella hongkongensis TaxID=178337 RepID=A0ABV9FA09_9BACL